MMVSTPQYLLFSDSDRASDSGQWRFVLRTVDGSGQFEAADVEPDVRGERLDLLTVVRALESLDQPSEVTIVACSPCIRQGMQYGLSEWRRNGWRWEFFGQMVPVKNSDLWRRMDRALRFHRVECRHRRLDLPHQPASRPKRVHRAKSGHGNGVFGGRVAALLWLRYWLLWAAVIWRRRLAAGVRW